MSALLLVLLSGFAAAQQASTGTASTSTPAAVELPGMDHTTSPVQLSSASPASLPLTPPVPAPPPAAAIPPAPPPAPPAPPAPRHPLDPLDALELSLTSRLLREDARFPEDGLFAYVALEEPSKKDVQRFDAQGEVPSRKAFAILLERARSRTYEAVVNLTKKKVERLAPKSGVQAPFLIEELTSAPAIVRADLGYREALRRRGITDVSSVHLDGWAPGTVGLAGFGGTRLVRVLSFYKGKSSNFYARPIEGLVAVVDMARRKVVRLDDTGEVPVSQEDGAFDEKTVGDAKRRLKPLEVRQPDGPGFERKGGQVVWGNWSFRIAMNPREGPVLYDVNYDDGGSKRKVLHRASLDEMVVPYGDPSSAWSWRDAFDVGEYGVGRLASPLELGTDVPASATLLDADFADDFGKTYVLKIAAALYERDGGLLWKHYTIEPESNESRRGRELVYGAVATVGNYDYALEWVFGQDGSIAFESRLTGIMLAKGLEGEAEDHYAHRLSTRVGAPHHQHFFNLRLDFDVDGTDNALYEAASMPSPEGPDNNAFMMELRPLKSELRAKRNLDLNEGRRWLVASDESRKDGHPGGWLLVPGENSVPYARPGSSVRRRAGFLDAHIWATRYEESELYAAGVYPNQSEGGDGLPRYVENDESLEGKDLVLWYTFGVTHNPRPEDWPIMPAHKTGVKLLPVGFFKRNPALTLPRPK